MTVQQNSAMMEEQSSAVEPDKTPAIAARAVWKVFGIGAAAFARTGPEMRTADALAQAGYVGAVQDASFDIAEGEVFVIMGLSGSGKSTLLRCLTRLVEPSEGQVLIQGEDILQLGSKALTDMRRRHMGMVFQHFALLPNRTVLGNIAFPLEVQGVRQAEAEARARDIIETVGLEGREKRFPSELSGGQQQRIGIARSLATDPDFWFLDEPFSALDPLIRGELQAELLRLQCNSKRTVVFVTHDLDEAIHLADRIAIMEAGRIVQIGTPEDLVMRPATDYVRRFVAKVQPARVVRVSSLMSHGAGAQNEAEPVQGEATIAQIGPVLLAGPRQFSVADTDGKIVGTLDRDKALSVLVETSSA